MNIARNTFSPLLKQEESLVIDFPIQHVYSAALKTANSRKRFSLKEENRTLNRIVVKTKVSAFSWGELLTIQLEDLGGRTKLTVSSMPKTGIGSRDATTQSFIGSRNKKNIDEFLNTLSLNLNY